MSQLVFRLKSESLPLFSFLSIPNVLPMRSFPLMLPRTFALVLLSVVLSGCEEPVTPAGKQQFAIPDSDAVVSHEKVLEILVKQQQFVLELDAQSYDILDNIRKESDVDHARQQLEKLNKKASTKLRGYTRSRLVVKMSDAEYEKLVAAIQESVQSFHERRKAMIAKRMSVPGSQGSKSHILESSNNKMLSLLAGLDDLLNTIGSEFLLERQYPEEMEATIILGSPKGVSEFFDYLQTKIDSSDVSYTRSRVGSVLQFAPVRDLQEFADSFDIGTVTRVDIETREIHVELSETDLELLKTKVKQLKAEEQRIADRKKQQERLEAKEQQARELLSALAERQHLLESCQDKLARITNLQSVGKSPMALLALCKGYRNVEGKIQKASGEGAEIPGEYQERTTRLMKSIDKEIARLNHDTKLRSLLAKHFGQNLTARRLLETNPPFLGFANPAEDSAHPDFLGANLVDLRQGSFFEQKHALERLAAINPATVKDPALRKEIARVFRDIALAHDGHGTNEALQPLVKWAGKHSVPILVQVLEKGAWFSQTEEIILALGKHPTEEGARAVAKFVGKMGEHELACRTLLSMGSLAEAATIEIAPSDDSDVSLAAIFILGEIGTEKSLPLLKQARTSTNRQVKRAASEAAKKIVRRSRNQKELATEK